MPLVNLTIDDQPVSVEARSTILNAARAIGIKIPTLCYLPGHAAQTSCFVCVVRVEGMRRLVPSCATAVADGMVVHSGSDEVRDARRASIELLLSDHLGDCVGPCQSVCPAHMDIPAMIRLIAEGRYRDALVTVKQAIPLPATLGRICPELCEKGCRRGQMDGAVSVCRLKRFVADVDLVSGNPYAPECAPSTGKRVAIVGAGPAGLSAAFFLLRMGHACTILDDHEKPGGMLRYGVPEEQLPRGVLSAEVDGILRMGAKFRGRVRIGRDVPLTDVLRDFDAVLIATGPMENGGVPTSDLTVTKQGIRVDRRTMMTSQPGVFVAGSAIMASKHAVRAVADGHAAAQAIDRYLAGEEPVCEPRRFSVHIGRLEPRELQPFLALGSADSRTASAAGPHADLTEEEARREAARCLRCNCAGASTCKLRQLAEEYDASPTRFKGDRRAFIQETSHPQVIYEPGKCIACGVCVQIAADMKEELGLAFVGRGFHVRTAVPFHAGLAEGLRKAARACAEACPTGALVLREDV